MSSEQRRHVLVVDDDARIADLIAAMLRTLGYTATLAVTSADALRAASSLHPDVVLLDATLPGVAGAELLDAIMRALPKTPVIVMTGDPRRADGLLQHGAAGYLAKPFRIEALHQTLRDMVL